ncbi:hypothetical protein J3E69DRAFT_346483 [Trichoderma sp. SZMC 28015]
MYAPPPCSSTPPKGTHHALHVCTMLDYRLMHLELTVSFYVLLFPSFLSHSHPLSYTHTLTYSLLSAETKTTHIESWDGERFREREVAFLQIHYQKNNTLVGRKFIANMRPKGRKRGEKEKHVEFVILYICIYMGHVFFLFPPFSVLALLFSFTCFPFFRIFTQIQIHLDEQTLFSLVVLFFSFYSSRKDLLFVLLFHMIPWQARIFLLILILYF